jgi:hypothetical protein
MPLSVVMETSHDEKSEPQIQQYMASKKKEYDNVESEHVAG